jgi:hypothetical protein
MAVWKHSTSIPLEIVKMIYHPLIELLEKLIKWWKSHTLPFHIWYVSFLSVALVAGIINKYNWGLSAGLLGIAILIICVFGFPVAWYEKRHAKKDGFK